MRANTKKRKKATVMLKATQEQEWWADQVVQVMLHGKRALDAVMLDVGRLVAETLMYMEREERSGPDYHPTSSGLMKWASQRGSIYVGDQKLCVEHPRLRGPEGEVVLRTYEQLKNRGGFSEELRRGVFQRGTQTPDPSRFVEIRVCHLFSSSGRCGRCSAIAAGCASLYWFSVKMTARLDVNATPGGRMSPIAPGIVPECSGASRVKRAARTGFAALDAPLRSLVLNACGREGTEWGSWDQSVHAGTLFARRSRRSFRACSSLRSRSDQIWVALPSMKSSGAM